jgi:hypothetical protein
VSDFTRDQALEDLLANPVGSVRTWAARWSWTIPRVHRFIRSLERSGAVEVLRSKAGTTVTQTVTPPETVTRVTVQNRPQPQNEGGVTAVTPCHLDVLLLDKSSRAVEGRYTERLIEAMNDVLGGISGYQRVSSDNYGSHRAGKQLIGAGVPIDFALEQLAQDCRSFNPSKHGKGQLPKSVALFTRGILRAWKRRGQLELGFPPRLKLDRTTNDIPVTPKSVVRDRNAAQFETSPAPELLGTLMSAYIEGQRTRQRG